MTAAPPQRWTGWDYESDPNIWSPELLSGETQYWLGESLLIGGVYEPGKTIARMYLPRKGETQNPSHPNEGYINLNAPYQYFNAGEWVEIESPWKESIPVLAKIGGAVVIGRVVATASPSPLESKEEFPSLVPDDYRGVEIFPPKGTSAGQRHMTVWYEDDGLTSNDAISTFKITYWSTEDKIYVEFQKETNQAFVPLWTDLEIILPVGDKRKVYAASEKLLRESQIDAKGRRRFIIS